MRRNRAWIGFDSRRGHVCEYKPVRKDCQDPKCTHSDKWIPPNDTAEYWAKKGT